MSKNKVITPLILAFIGGFFDIYALMYRGGKFCFLQTGNLIYLARDLIVSDYNNVLLCLLIFLSFTVGLVLAYLISYLLKKINKEKYSKLVLLIIIFILIIPNYFFSQTITFDLSYLAVFMLSIIGGILLESFRTSYVSYTSTMMTNNYKLFIHSLLTRTLLKDKEEGKKTLMYLFIIISFLLGVLFYTLFYKYNIIRQQIIFVPHLLILGLIGLEYLDIKKDGVKYEK